MPRPPADHWITPPGRGTEGITARSLLVHPERAAEQRDDLHAQLGPVLGQRVQSPERSACAARPPPSWAAPPRRPARCRRRPPTSPAAARAGRPQGQLPVHRLHGPRTGRRSWRRRAGRAARPRRQRGGPRRRSGRRSRPPGASSRPAVGVKHEGAWCWIGHGSGASLRVLVQGPAGVAVTASGTGRAHRGAALLSSRPSALVMARGRHS